MDYRDWLKDYDAFLSYTGEDEKTAYRPFPLTITSCTWFIALLGIFIVPACGPGELGLKTTSVRQCSPGVNTRPLHRELVWNSGSVEVIEPIVMEAF